MKKLYLALLIICFFAPFAFSQNETITITTYYPAPYGVYNELKLQPHNPPVIACNNVNHEGTLYYDLTSHLLMICTTENGGTSYIWKSVTGAGSSGATAGQKACAYYQIAGSDYFYMSVPPEWTIDQCRNFVSIHGGNQYSIFCFFADGTASDSPSSYISVLNTALVPPRNCGWQ